MPERKPRNIIEISDDTFVCNCHGRPVYRLYQPDGRTHRYRDQCVISGTDLGYDAAVTRAQWLLSAQAARLAATAEAAA